MIISHNILAMNANRQLGIATKNKAKSSGKLSSGYRINRAADNAAGLAISEKMRGQIRGLDRGAANSEDGQSLLKVADGALEEVQEIIIRIRELSVQAANDTNTIDDRNAIQNEIDSLKAEINRISADTEFNTKKLFNTGYVNDDDYGITIDSDASEVDIDVLLRSLSASGVPQDTSETIYNISASQSGMNINGNMISWNNVVNITSGGNLADSVISSGTYMFNYNGTDISFDVPANASLDDIANALNGIEVDVNAIYSSTQINSYSVDGTDSMGGTYSLSTTVSSNGNKHTLFLKNPRGVQQSVSIEQLLQNSLSGNTLNFKLGKFDFSLEFANTPTVEDVANYLNGASFQTVDNGLKHLDYYSGMASRVVSGTTVCYYELRVTEVNDTFLAENGYQQNTDIVTLPLESIYPPSTMYDGRLKANGNIYSITSDSWDKINEITASGGIHKGDVVFIDFQSNTGGKFTVEYKSGTDCADAKDWLFIENPMNGLPNVISVKLRREYNADNNLALTFQNPSYAYTIKKDGKDILQNEEAGNQGESYNRNGQLWIQLGAGSGDGMYITIGDMNANLLGLSDANVTSWEGAEKSITASSKALDIVSKQRSRIGAQQNRLECAASIARNTAENMQNAESKIRDSDMAEEMVKYSKQSILEQVGQSVLAQVNQSSQSVLSLLQ